MSKTTYTKALLLGAILTILFSSDPSYAQTGGALFDSGTNFLNALVDLLTNVWARIIGIIAIVITGFVAMTGRLSFRIVFLVVFGLVLVFGSAAIVDSVAGSV